jgi:hypothetical protein
MNSNTHTSRLRRALACLQLYLVVTCLWLPCPATLQAAEATPTRRADLVGAWRLLRIERDGPAGIEPDAFYGPGTAGLLIYDASGAISVQIAGQKRPTLEVPLTRPVPAGSAADIAAERAAFHSYYAYTGTWSYDESTSVCTHHVEVALLAVEQGHSYQQEVRREGDHLVFIRRGQQNGSPVIYRKVWQKI